MSAQQAEATTEAGVGKQTRVSRVWWVQVTGLVDLVEVSDATHVWNGGKRSELCFDILGCQRARADDAGADDACGVKSRLCPLRLDEGLAASLFGQYRRDYVVALCFAEQRVRVVRRAVP